MAQGHGADFILNFVEVGKISRLLTLFCEALLDQTSICPLPGTLSFFGSSNIPCFPLLWSPVLAAATAQDSALLFAHLCVAVSFPSAGPQRYPL